MAWTMCTKNDVMLIYPFKLEELQDGWSDMVEGLIREYLGQKYLGDTAVILGELQSGDGSPILHVKYPPIYSVESVRVGGLLLSPADYDVTGSFIHLRYTNFPKGNLNVSVDYTSGTLEIKESVRLTAASMIVALVNYKRRFGSDSSFKWGASEQRTGEEDASSRIGLASHLKSIMKEMLQRPRVRVR